MFRASEGCPGSEVSDTERAGFGIEAGPGMAGPGMAGPVNDCWFSDGPGQ